MPHAFALLFLLCCFALLLFFAFVFLKEGDNAHAEGVLQLQLAGQQLRALVESTMTGQRRSLAATASATAAASATTAASATAAASDGLLALLNRARLGFLRHLHRSLYLLRPPDTGTNGSAGTAGTRGDDKGEGDDAGANTIAWIGGLTFHKDVFASL